LIPTLRDVHQKVDDIQFVSVSNEAIGTVTSRDDLTDWWRAYDGNWTVGIDTDIELTAELDINTVPSSFVFDAEYQLVDSETGHKTSETLLAWIESA